MIRPSKGKGKRMRGEGKTRAAGGLTAFAAGFGLAAAAACFGLAAGRAGAADLSQPPGPPARPGTAAKRPDCRLVPQPHSNLAQDDVIGFDPSWICISRGMLADRLPPPPPHPPRPWFWW